MIRRSLLSSALGALSLSALPLWSSPLLAQPGSVMPSPAPDRPLLLRGATLLSLSRVTGDHERGDMLVLDGRIAEIASSISHAEAQVVNLDGMVLVPGFVDTHRHMWQGQLRNSIPDGTLQDYVEVIIRQLRPHYRPEDVLVGNYLSALSALDAGITTVLDWSHIGSSPAHSDAAIEGLRQSGIRAVYGYGDGESGPQNRYPEDIRRLRREHFSSADQRLTLALAAGTNTRHWQLAREEGAAVTSHINGRDVLPALRDAMGEDNTYIHCTQLSDSEFDLIAETGGGVSIAGPVEMVMGHGEPPFRQVLSRNIRWALSNDVETGMPTDFFTQMQHAFSLQRMQHFNDERDGRSPVPRMQVKDMLEVATLGGARVNHLDSVTGSLEAGKAADFIVLDPGRINVMPMNDAYGAVVMGMDSANVRHVFVAGQALKWEGQLVGVDLAALLRRAQASRDFIFRAAGLSTSVLP